MGIGDVFAKAWGLWRRDVGWLILAGLTVGVIMIMLGAIASGIFTELLAGAGFSVSGLASGEESSLFSGLSLGLIVVTFIVYVVVVYLVQVLGMTFAGGMFEMVIGSYRDKRPVRYGDLFSGFRRFGAYAVYALAWSGITIGLNLLGSVIPIVGPFGALIITVWLAIAWLYVVPLIADQGLGFTAAARRSREMVQGAGWWWTFGMVVLLGVFALVLLVVIALVARAAGQGDATTGLITGALLALVFGVLFPPYLVCYVSVLYVGSGGEEAPAPAAVATYAVPSAPPAPPAYGAPAPPAYGSSSSVPQYGTPPPVTSRPAGSAAQPSAPPSGGDAAWRAAADPLSQSPAPTARSSASPGAAPSSAPFTPTSATPAPSASAGRVPDAPPATRDGGEESGGDLMGPTPPEPPAPPASPMPG